MNFQSYGLGTTDQSGARPKAVSKVSLAGFGEPLRNLRLHVRIAHRRPSPGAQKLGRKPDLSKTHQIGTDRAPGERWWRPAELPACSRAYVEAEWAAEVPPEE